MSSRVEQLPNISAVLDERLGVTYDPHHRLLLFLDVRDMVADVLFFRLKAEDVELNSRKPADRRSWSGEVERLVADHIGREAIGWNCLSHRIVFGP